MNNDLEGAQIVYRLSDRTISATVEYNEQLKRLEIQNIPLETIKSMAIWFNIFRS